MNNFYKRPVNNVVEKMNNNYINYQNDLDRLQNKQNNKFNNFNQPQNNADEKPSSSSEFSNKNAGTNNLLELLKNANLSSLLPMLSNNANISDLLSKPENKNELIMNLLSNMNNVNNIGSQKKQYEDIDISNLPKIDDYNIL